jgi:hypothetical protein
MCEATAKIIHISMGSVFSTFFLNFAGPQGLGRKNYKIEAQWIRTFIASVSEPY